MPGRVEQHGVFGAAMVKHSKSYTFSEVRVAKAGEYSVIVS